MATQTLQRDLMANDPLVTSDMLSSLSPYLSASFAETISGNVIRLMNSSNPAIRRKAIIAFYHICSKSPGILKTGFTVLREQLQRFNE